MEIISYLVSSLSLLVIAATMLARANDLRWRKGLHWNARLVGFVLAGFAPVGIILHEGLTQHWPNVYEVFFRLGLTLVFLTTPYLPPWWKWISGIGGEPEQYSDDRRKG